MDKLKLITVIGTRPELIKMSEIIKACDKYFDHTLVHTGQNYDYELNKIFFEDLSLREPDYYLDVAAENLGRTMGNVIASSYELMAELSPDALLVLGDTNSALCVISAKRLKIPIFHLEAGNRCFDENLPEEINRRIIDHTSDINLCYSEHARRNLNSEGIRPEYTFVVGSPMAEVIRANSAMIDSSNVLESLELSPGKYIILSAHREENIDIEANFNSLMESINFIAEKYNLPIIYSMHPRSAKHLNTRGVKLHPNVKKMKPFGFHDYMALQRNAFCVVSDSGTLPEEASLYKFPAVSIRTSTERQEAMDTGNFIIGSITSGELSQAVDMAVEMYGDGYKGSQVIDYVQENISDKVVRIIQGYTGVVNNIIWRK